MSRKEIHIIHQILQYMKSCTAPTSASLSKIARSGELNILLTTLIDHDPMTMETVLSAATKACVTSKGGAAPGHQAKRKPGANVEVTRPTKITKVSSYSSKNAFEPQHDKEGCHETENDVLVPRSTATESPTSRQSSETCSMSSAVVRYESDPPTRDASTAQDGHSRNSPVTPSTVDTGIGVRSAVRFSSTAQDHDTRSPSLHSSIAPFDSESDSSTEEMTTAKHDIGRPCLLTPLQQRRQPYVAAQIDVHDDNRFVFMRHLREETQSEDSYTDMCVSVAEIHDNTCLTPTEVSQGKARYIREVGITNYQAEVVDSIRAYCLTKHASLSKTDKQKGLEDILDRLKKPGTRTEIPSTWNLTDPDKIFDAIQTIKGNNEDGKIHRAYGQIRLHESGKEKSEGLRAWNTPTNSKHLAPHLMILDNLAEKDAGEVSANEKDKKRKRYKSDYEAGKRWQEVAKFFGGTGIVAIFVCVEIGSSYVAKSWIDFQRECLGYISASLYSIRELVETIGDDSL